MKFKTLAAIAVTLPLMVGPTVAGQPRGPAAGDKHYGDKPGGYVTNGGHDFQGSNLDWSGDPKFLPGTDKPFQEKHESGDNR